MTESVRCAVCQQNPERMNSHYHECSHVACPHRRVAWSERPSPVVLGLRTRLAELDELPLDRIFRS